MNKWNAGNQVTRAKTIIIVFSIILPSQEFCFLLREDFALPSASTLTKITSFVAHVRRFSFALKEEFSSLTEQQIIYILLHIEIYVIKC